MLHENKHWGCQEYPLSSTSVKLPFLLHLMCIVFPSCCFCNIFSSIFLNSWRWIQVKNYSSMVAITCFYDTLLLKLSLMFLKKMESLSFSLSVSSSFLSHFSWCPCCVASHLLDFLRTVLQTLFFSLSQPFMYYTLITFRNVCSLSEII